MAELLIKAVDAVHSDPVKDLRGCYKKGDVVVVKPDGWKWGKEELKKEKFYILKVTDKSVEELQFLTKEDEIELGTRYVAEASKLGVTAEAPDETTATKACQARVDAVVERLQKYGLSPSYQIATRTEPIRHVVARRRHRINVENIESALQKDTVELTSDKISIMDKPEGTTVTLAELAN